MSFIGESYRIHANTYADKDDDKLSVELYTNWFDRDSIDVWRHKRMLSCLDPFLKAFPSSGWITVGDGMLGTSSIYINKAGCDCVASDIDTTLLEKAFKLGWLKSYRLENAERISCEDETFDFAFCKEAFHHFPQPYVGLSEMLRISRKAVILSEPADWLPGPLLKQILVRLKSIGKRLLFREQTHTDEGNFEPIGNYVFTISVREMEKICMALHLPYFAYRRFNDYYWEGMEYQSVASPHFRKLNRKLLYNRILSC
jgi:ubiquinone/menaquinone biosynthesis C-methylase UbiE